MRSRCAFFFTLTTLGGFTRGFRENRDLLVFGGVWALREIPGPNRPKNFDTPKIEKKSIFFLLRFEKMCSRQKQSDFFRLRPLVRTEKT